MLVLLGLGVLVARWREPGAFLLLLWGGGVFGAGGVLIDRIHAPAFNHWTAAFPAVALALALPPVLWLRALAKSESRTKKTSIILDSALFGTRPWLQVGTVLVGMGMLALALANGYMYLVTYPATVPPSFEAAQGRYLATLTPQDRVRFVGNSWKPYFADIRAMLAPTVPASDLLNPSRSLPLVGDPVHDLMFVFNNDEAAYLPLVQSYYPGGQAGHIATPGGPIGDTYRLCRRTGRRRAWRTIDPGRHDGA